MQRGRERHANVLSGGNWSDAGGSLTMSPPETRPAPQKPEDCRGEGGTQGRPHGPQPEGLVTCRPNPAVSHGSLPSAASSTDRHHVGHFAKVFVSTGRENRADGVTGDALRVPAGTVGHTPGSSRRQTCGREKGHPARHLSPPGAARDFLTPHADDRGTWREWPQSTHEDLDVAGPHRRSHGRATSSADACVSCAPCPPSARRWVRPLRFRLA